MNKGSDAGDASRSITYLIFVILTLLLIGLQIYHASGQPYTPPEDWAVYGSALPVSDGNRLFSVDYAPLNIWTTFFGTTTPVTRYFSVLFTVLGYAFLFRLCADLFNKRIALTAILLIGTLTVVQDLIWQAQPFAALLMITPAMLLSWMRWMQFPGRKNAALNLGISLVSVYISTFSSLFIFAQAGFWLLFIPRSKKRDRRTLALFVIITLLALPRILAYGSVLESGLPFNSWFALDLLHMPISIAPAEFAQLLGLLTLAVIAIGLGSPAGHSNWLRLRGKAKWPLAYTLTMLLLFALLLVILVNLPVGVLFGLAAFPIIIILSAWGLSAFPRIVQGLVLIAVVIFAVVSFRNPMPVATYQDIVARTLSADAGSNARLVIAAPYVWQHLPFLHYAPADRTFHLMRNAPMDDTAMLMPPERTVYQNDPTSQANFSQFIGQAAEVWLYNEQFDNEWVSDFTINTLSSYDEISPTQRSWDETETPAYGNLRKFVSIPDDLSNLFVFGDQLSLQAWLLQNSVNVTPCQRITVQSWWSAEADVPNNLSMTLVIVNASDGQGIANADGQPTGRDSSALIQQTPHIDERSLQIPCDVTPGEYPLLIGVYGLSGDNINQLPVSLADGTPVGNFAYLTTLFVQP